MQWDQSLSIGVPQIDQQHQEWIDRLNAVTLATQAGQGQSRVVEALDFLVDYTEYHFESEERLMADERYPELDEHRQKHRELTRTLANLEQDFDEDGVTPALVQAIDTLVGNWLVQHIQEVDRRFGVFLRNRSQS